MKIAVLTGAGVSAESGIRTFRDSGGLWEDRRVEDVASPEAWQRNRRLVLEFYNQRRRQVLDARPNAAHLALAKLQKKHKVHIVTQNVDDLHERAGSKQVLHLHGELRKARSTADESLVYDIRGWELKEGQLCARGSQLRPHIVWFGEAVPNIIPAQEIVSKAELLLVVGTSLEVYPAAGLIHCAGASVPKYLVDPQARNLDYIGNLTVLRRKAGEGVPGLVEELLKK